MVVSFDQKIEHNDSECCTIYSNNIKLAIY